MHPNFTGFLVGLSSQVFCSLIISTSMLCPCSGCMVMLGSPRILGPELPFRAWCWHQIFWAIEWLLQTCCRPFHALFAFALCTCTSWRIIAPSVFRCLSFCLGFGFGFSFCFGHAFAGSCLGFQGIKCCILASELQQQEC